MIKIFLNINQERCFSCIIHSCSYNWGKVSKLLPNFIMDMELYGT